LAEDEQADEPNEKDGPAPKDIWAARIALSIYAFFLIILAGIGFYILFYVILLVSFLVLVVHIDKLETFEIVSKLNLKKKILLIFIIALLTRLVMLVQGQIITDDILNYVLRGEMMLDGMIPYVDFYGGSKPPLHNLVLLMVSGAFGAGEGQFRVVFSIVDALIAVSILYLSASNRGSRFLLSAALLYALCPINVITIGLSGHFDPVPALAVVISTIFLISRRHRLSSLFLGLGFALKVFGAVLLPYYVLKTEKFKERVLYVLLFTIPMGLSLLGMYILSPDAPGLYLSETSGWGGWWSFTHLATTAIESDAVGDLKVSWIFMGLFLLLILAMYVSIWRKKDEEERTTLLWYKVVVFISAAYLGLMILDGWAQAPPGTSIAPALIVFVVYVVVLGIVIYRYRETIFPEKLSGGRTERILIISSLAIILFCFGLPNYAPWYIIWFLPILLAVRTNSIRFTLIFLLVWHIMGKGVSIFPGLPPIG
jgi:hypothetical protein